jgi:signal transduction histidine kinase
MARVARILHDDVGQVLSAIGLQIDVMRMDFVAQAPGIAERSAEIQQLLEKAIDRVRDLSFELNPATVERAGLQFALERMVGRVRQNYKGTVRLMYDSSVRLLVPQAPHRFKF